MLPSHLGRHLLLRVAVAISGICCCVHGAAPPPKAVAISGYTVQAGDCGYAVCATVIPGPSGGSNLTRFAASCNATAGCEGFNSNGWLKRCLPPRCPSAESGMEPGAPCNLYTKIGAPRPPTPPTPPAPVAAIADRFYPLEERTEARGAAAPIVTAVTAGGKCVLQSPTDGATASGEVGDQIFGQNWTILAVVPGEQACVLERRWSKWSLIVSASATTSTKWNRALRKPLGNSLAALSTPLYNLTGLEPDYFTKASNVANDYIGQRILNDSKYREASFLTAAKFLPPTADYVVIGDTHAPVKAVVTMDGKIKRSDGGDNEPLLEHQQNMQCDTSVQCNTPPRDRSYCYRGNCVGGGGTVFDGAAYLDIAPPTPGHFRQMQTGVLGGHLRVAAVATFDNTSAQMVGFEMLALGPLSFDNDTLLVAIRSVSIASAAHPRAAKNWSYLSLSLDRAPCTGGPPSHAPYCESKRCCDSTPEAFYAAVLEHASEWRNVFGDSDYSDASSSSSSSALSSPPAQSTAMQPTIPYAERRQLDMARGVIVAASTVWIGDKPNYGTGGDYWLSGPPVRAMMDTSAVPDSLPLTSLALDTALLQWGLFPSALAKIGFYFDTFIFANGTIDMGHWKDNWADGGDGEYNCTFPDGLTDMGRILQLFSNAVRMTRNVTWLNKHLSPALLVGRYLLAARAAAKVKFPRSDPRYGMIYGPAEHDTCTMGMGGAPAIVDGQYMLYYFSVSMQSWRGMIELGQLLLDFSPAITESEDISSNKFNTSNITAFAEVLLEEASAFKIDIDAQLAAASVVTTKRKTTQKKMIERESGDNVSSSSLSSHTTITFVPIAVVPHGTKPPPYSSMTQDTVASYSNFRYYSEMLSSGEMPSEYAVALMEFREEHGGMLSGMSRYLDRAYSTVSLFTEILRTDEEAAVLSPFTHTSTHAY